MAASALRTTARLFSRPASLTHLIMLAMISLGNLPASSAAVEERDGSSFDPSSADLVPTLAALQATPSDPSATSVVAIFYIDERAYEGLPYTVFHRDSGNVIGVDAQATTFVITTTRTDQRSKPSPTRPHTDNGTTTPAASNPSSPTSSGHPAHSGFNFTFPSVGFPSTITQGPSTFLYTGTRFGPNHTIVNQCRLNGISSAACNLTHVGAVWYTADPGWNGTYSTYSYNWTSGDRFGFAPVTITAGVNLMAPPGATAGTASGSASANGAAGRTARGGWGGCGWLEGAMGMVMPVVVLVVAVVI